VDTNGPEDGARMTHNPRKLVGFFALLLGIWIVTYWLWAPAPPAITFGESSTGPDSPRPPALTRVVSEPVAPPAPSPAVAGARTPQPQTEIPTRQVMEKPQFREYTVQRGDTSFEAIAARREVYGDKKLGGAIAGANPLVSPHKLIAGRTVLRIPLDPSNIQGKVVTIKSPPVEPPTKPVPPAEDEFYTVQPGDTLSGIAKARYGRSALWELILEANSDQLTDPAKIKAGMRLRMPPAPAPANTR
jgi:nucleoid-associated protein YgaU